MFRFIEKLQAKPRHVRERILYVTVIIFSALIFTLWFVFRFVVGVDAPEEDVSAPIVPGPIDALLGESKQFFQDFGKGIEEIKNLF